MGLFLSLNELDLPRCKSTHAQEYQTVFKAGNIGASVSAVFISDRKFNDLEIEFMRAKNKIIITKGIKLPEEGTVTHQMLVIFSENNFRSA